ncbi:MAG: tRNA uridine-5-carboxymethylaminomethyl(34) synthesis enzyme MnmG, partial [Candidatus Wallbacteria bacterium]|nr:tRNA uridine-5-carboxymethylaminomethyl(34) synthesis enzyme MnmG [Candidatus Wallbacteria bacterium]
MDHFEVIVIGGGHAGCEAAIAAAKLGARTLIATLSLDGFGLMPCNPSMGGPGKSQLLRDIDALGGITARLADRSALQYRILNSKRGAAARALRSQNDLRLYSRLMKSTLESTVNLEILQGEVTDILAAEKGFVIEFRNGLSVSSERVIVTTGTFLRGKIFIGEFCMPAGRIGEPPAVGLYGSLKRMGVSMIRLKTGTTSRVNVGSLKLEGLEVQHSEEVPFKFSHYDNTRPLFTMDCYLTRTNEKTIEVVRKNIHRSPLYGGRIQGVGPRYCPSFEDKVMKFPHRKSHVVFIEPESAGSAEYYLQGLTSSLPEEVQLEFLQTVPGLETVKVIKPGYAVEYDSVLSTGLRQTLEHRDVPGLFFAGQVNGTSGYEEAACQGLVAGINAVRGLRGLSPFVLARSQSMIGVLIDDLVSKGSTEPYR